MEEDQLQMELDWCLCRLEEKLAALDPYSRQAQEAAKVHRILKSSKAPVIKKRQAMRNMFGDYRAKIKAAEKKSLAAVKKAKLVAVTEPPSQSKFFKHSAGAATSHQQAERMSDSATDNLNQLSVSCNQSPDEPQGSCATDNEAAKCEAAETKAVKNELAENHAAKPEATDEFRFNFSGNEGPQPGDSVAAKAACSETTSHNYFKFQPASEEFRFNFAAEEASK